MKKIIYLFLILCLATSCGFTPIYVANQNIDFSIEDVIYEGDQELNNFIDIHLKKYTATNNQKTSFKISTITEYKKETQTKDVKGNAQSFKVEGFVTFVVTGNNQTFNFAYTEQSDLNNSDNAYELKTYENSIKQNFASSMIEKLILDLSNR